MLLTILPLLIFALWLSRYNKQNRKKVWEKKFKSFIKPRKRANRWDQLGLAIDSLVTKLLRCHLCVNKINKLITDYHILHIRWIWNFKGLQPEIFIFTTLTVIQIFGFQLKHPSLYFEPIWVLLLTSLNQVLIS